MKIKKLFPIVSVLLIALSIQNLAVAGRTPQTTPDKSAEKTSPDLCLTTGSLGFIFLTKTDQGNIYKLAPPDVLKSVVQLCTASLETKDEFVNTQKKTYYRGIARYYLIRGLDKPLRETMANLGGISAADISATAKDLKTASEYGLSFEDNNIAYLYAGEMTALLSVKQSSKTLQKEALDLWRQAEDQSAIINAAQAANTKKILMDDRQALAEAWNNPVLNSLTLQNKPIASTPAAQTPAPVKNVAVVASASVPAKANPAAKSAANVARTRATPANVRLSDEAVLRASDLYDKQWNLTAALAEAEKAVKLNPQNSRALDLRDKLALEYNRLKAAAEASSASAFFNAGDLKSALADAENALKIDPQNSLALIIIGNIHLKNNEIPQAIEKFNAAVAADPKNFQPYYMRARAYAQANNYKAAIADSDKAIENDPRCARCYLYRGIYYSELINWDQARDDAKKALELKPDWAEAKKNYEFFAQQAVGIDAATIPDPKEVEEKRNSNATSSSSSGNGASSAMYSIEMTYDQQSDELKEAVRKYEGGRSCSALQEVKSIAWDIKKFIEKEIRSYEYGNIKLTRNEYNRLQTMLGRAEENIGIFARLDCR